MMYASTPSERDIARLFAVRADACVSIYLRTTPIPAEVKASRIEFSNLVREALTRLERRGIDKGRLVDLEELLGEVQEDDELWRYQANSLAVFATPDDVKTFRLANHLESTVEVADRFDLKSLLRATTFEHAAYVVALSEDSVRLVEIFPDLPPEVIEVPDLPESLASELRPEGAGQRPLTRHGGKGDRGDTGAMRKRELTKYCRRIDAALAPVLQGSDVPVIVMAVQPIASIFHNLCSAPNLLPEILSRSPDRATPAEIAAEARGLLEEHYRERVAGFREHYEQRFASHRASNDLAEVARAATMGAVETLYVDIEGEAKGTIDESGAVDWSADREGSYGLASEITRRALASGAQVVALRQQDMPAPGEVAATLRFAG